MGSFDIKRLLKKKEKEDRRRKFNRRRIDVHKDAIPEGFFDPKKP